MTIKGEDGEPLPMPTDIQGDHPVLVAETADISGGGNPTNSVGKGRETGSLPSTENGGTGPV